MKIPHISIRKILKFWRPVIILAILSALLSLLCLFPAACDWYTDRIYVILGSGLSRLSALPPFSPGEAVELLKVPFLILCGVLLVLLIILRKKPKGSAFCKGSLKAAAVTVCCYQLLSLLFSIIPECGNVLGQDPEGKRTAYGLKELTALYSYLNSGLDTAAAEIEIAPDGTVPFPDIDTLQPQIVEAMRSYADAYPRLAGYYPPVRAAFDSENMHILNIGGIAFSNTQDAVYNKYLYPTEAPATVAHELAHLKGFIKENEANFISELALSQCENPYLRFSAFSKMLHYVAPEYNELYSQTVTELKESGVLPPIDHNSGHAVEDLLERQHILNAMFGEIPLYDDDRVQQINDAAAGIFHEVYDADPHPIDEQIAENPEKLVEVIENANQHWEEYEAQHKENYYDGVVLLLLQYYDGVLY
ncbi:MAG: DUF3810 family protein [Oscillospiraceae bacterium]|nr:DUF3810 family protein [Oscillospiraceae bacterium]